MHRQTKTNRISSKAGEWANDLNGLNSLNDLKCTNLTAQVVAWTASRSGTRWDHVRGDDFGQNTHGTRRHQFDVGVLSKLCQVSGIPRSNWF